MEEKGNKIENWDTSYESFESTYSEELVTPANLANYVQNQFVLEDIRKYLPETTDPKVLECGCGGARTSLFLALRGFKNLTGSDYAPEALRLAQSNFAKYKKHANFVQDDLLHSKLQSESFDCVMSFGLLEHFDDIRALSKAITRLVKPGGIQIHCVITKKFSTQTLINLVWYLPRLVKRVIKGEFSGIFVKSFRDFPHYENSFTEAEYRAVFSGEGNEIIKCEAGGILLPFYALPAGIGNWIVKTFFGVLSGMTRVAGRSQSKFMHFIAPTFYLVCRKNVGHGGA